MSSLIRAEEFFMRLVSRICIVVLAAVAFGGGIGTVAQTQAQAQDEPRGDAGNGKRVYLALGCFTCHGRSGQGGAYNGPAPILASTALPFDGFKGQIRNPANDMPAYSDAVLSDKDVADIYAFVKSLPGSRSAKDIPILNN
jgi:mono/diheme cytochrome c family protein